MSKNTTKRIASGVLALTMIAGTSLPFAESGTVLFPNVISSYAASDNKQIERTADLYYLKNYEGQNYSLPSNLPTSFTIPNWKNYTWTASDVHTTHSLAFDDTTGTVSVSPYEVEKALKITTGASYPDGKWIVYFTGTNGSSTIRYTVTVHDYGETLREQKIAEILSQIITDDMTETEKVRAVMNYMTKNCKYGQGDPLLEGEGDCIEANKAAIMILRRLGVKARLRYAAWDTVDDWQNNMNNHYNCWAEVDGELYILDATAWGADKMKKASEYSFFLGRGKTDGVYLYDTLDDGTLQIKEIIGVANKSMGTWTIPTETTIDGITYKISSLDCYWLYGGYSSVLCETGDPNRSYYHTRPFDEVIVSRDMKMECSYDRYDFFQDMIYEGVKIYYTDGTQVECKHTYQTSYKYDDCEKDGTATYKCTNCGYTYSETVGPKGHNWKKSVLEEPTCEEEGWYRYRCTTCQKAYSDFPAPLGHDLENVKVTKKATCTEDGIKSGTCSRCGKTVEETIKASGHKYDSGKVTKKATCTENGEKTYTCSVCGNTKKEAIKASGHKYDEGVVAKEATCTKSGTKTYTCSECGSKKTETIKAKGHSYEESVVEPTADKQGYTLHTCKDCGDSYKDHITQPTAPHTHSYTEEILKEATCTEDGLVKKTCSCGDEATETIKAKGHKFNQKRVTKQATCTEDGEETYYCDICKATKKEVIKATGHKYEVTKTVPATYGSRGYTVRTCKNCGHKMTSYTPQKKLGKTVFTSYTSTPNSVTINWNKVEGATGYKVYMYLNYRYVAVGTVKNGKTSFTKNNLSSASSHNFYVRAYVKENGKTYWEDNSDGIIRANFVTKPSKVKLTSKTSASKTSVRINWKNTKATGFRIYRYNSATKKWDAIKTVKGYTTFKDTKLKSKTTYKYKVKAYYDSIDEFGVKRHWGKSSDVKSVKTK